MTLLERLITLREDAGAFSDAVGSMRDNLLLPLLRRVLHGDTDGDSGAESRFAVGELVVQVIGGEPSIGTILSTHDKPDEPWTYSVKWYNNTVGVGISQVYLASDAHFCEHPFIGGDLLSAVAAVDEALSDLHSRARERLQITSLSASCRADAKGIDPASIHQAYVTADLPAYPPKATPERLQKAAKDTAVRYARAQASSIGIGYDKRRTHTRVRMPWFARDVQMIQPDELDVYEYPWKKVNMQASLNSP